MTEIDNIAELPIWAKSAKLRQCIPNLGVSVWNTECRAAMPLGIRNGPKLRLLRHHRYCSLQAGLLAYRPTPPRAVLPRASGMIEQGMRLSILCFSAPHGIFPLAISGRIQIHISCLILHITNIGSKLRSVSEWTALGGADL